MKQQNVKYDIDWRKNTFNVRQFRNLIGASQDFRYAWRALFRNPAFAASSILILALGMAANTLIYSVTDSVLLRPLPFHEPDRLAMAWERHPIIGRQQVALPDFHDWQTRNHTFSDLAAYTMQGEAVPLWSARTDPQPLQASMISWNLVPLLGLTPELGRVFTQENDRPGHDAVVLLSHHLWSTRFGSDPRAIGSFMTLDGEPFRIIGVMAEGMMVPYWADICLPLSRAGPDTALRRASHNLEVIGRLKPGISVAQADSDLQRIALELAREYPLTNGPTRANVISARENYVGHIERALVLLQIGAALLLLICCANVAIFSLVRAAERRIEVEVRAALGATPSRLFLVSVSESFLLALISACLGLALARLGFAIFESHIRELLPFSRKLQFDWRTLAFSLGLCLMTGLGFGLYPSIQMVHRLGLHVGSRTITKRRSAASSLIVAQTALSIVVVVSAGLLARSLHEILRVDPGFEARRLVTMRLQLPTGKYKDDAALDGFYERLFTKVRSLPGVAAVAVTSQRLLTRSGGRFWIGGRPDPPADAFPVAQFRFVSPEFFDVLGLHLTAGRLPHATGEPQPAAWINQAFERRYFRDSQAPGNSILLGLFRPPRRQIPIVGVVSDMRDLGLTTNPEPTVYFIASPEQSTLFVRLRQDASPAAGALQALLRETDSEAWASPPEVMHDVFTGRLRDRQLAVELLALFALMSCLLAALGIQAVVTQAVTERTREVGIRLAIGAECQDLIQMFVFKHLRSVAAGIVVGTVLAIVSASLLKRLLFGVGTVDAATYGVTVSLILIVTSTAAYLAARRVVRIDPLTALRAE